MKKQLKVLLLCIMLLLVCLTMTSCKNNNDYIGIYMLVSVDVDEHEPNSLKKYRSIEIFKENECSILYQTGESKQCKYTISDNNSIIIFSDGKTFETVGLLNKNQIKIQETISVYVENYRYAEKMVTYIFERY